MTSCLGEPLPGQRLGGDDSQACLRAPHRQVQTPPASERRSFVRPGRPEGALGSAPRIERSSRAAPPACLRACMQRQAARSDGTNRVGVAPLGLRVWARLFPLLLRQALLSDGSGNGAVAGRDFELIFEAPRGQVGLQSKPHDPALGIRMRLVRAGVPAPGQPHPGKLVDFSRQEPYDKV